MYVCLFSRSVGAGSSSFSYSLRRSLFTSLDSLLVRAIVRHRPSQPRAAIDRLGEETAFDPRAPSMNLVLTLTVVASIASFVGSAPPVHSAARVDGAAADPPAGVRSLDGLLAPIRAKHDVPALAAAIVTGDGLKAIGAVGVRAAGAAGEVTTGDLWHIGSDTKAMTALLCAILVEQGRLEWSSTLAEIFPDVAPAMHADYRAATLEQLCTNRAGFPADLDDDGLWDRLWSHAGTPVEARRLLLESVTRRPPDAAPGTRFIYSNAGFAVAGHVCETVTGTPYEELIDALLFRPLGIASAGFGAPGTPGTIDQPRGHDRRGAPREPTADGRGADNPPAITPAGRLHLSLADWSKLVRLHVRGARGEPQGIGAVTLSADTLRRIHTPPPDGDYAMGWIRTRRPWAGPPDDCWTYTHSGSNTMWFAVVWIAPARDFAVIACCNQAERGDSATDEAAAALIRDHLQRAGPDGASR